VLRSFARACDTKPTRQPANARHSLIIVVGDGHETTSLQPYGGAPYGAGQGHTLTASSAVVRFIEHAQQRKRAAEATPS
jgi:hypothetical protein